MEQTEEYYPFEPEKKNTKATFMMTVSLAVIVVALALGVLAGRPLLSGGGPSKGDRMIPFQGTSVFGEEIDTEDFSGKVLVLDFWATWCPPCVQKMPELMALQREFADQGVQLLGVSGDMDPEQLRAFEIDRKVNFPTIYHGSRAVIEAYDIKGFPTTIVVNRSGKIVHRSFGSNTRGAILEALD